MKTVTKQEWTDSIQFGDFGLCRGRGVFAYLENLFRKKEHEGATLATHGFFCKGKDVISEAVLPCITGGNKITRYLDGKDSVWIWRCANISDTSLDILKAVSDTEEDQKEPYGSYDIINKGMHFLFGTPLKDKHGTFCTQYLWRLAHAAALPFPAVPSFECDPSLIQNWFESVQNGKWVLSALYANGIYSISE